MHEVSPSTLVFSHPEFEDELLAEARHHSISLAKVSKGLFEAAKHNGSLAWARDVWKDVEIVDFDTVSKAAAELRTRSKLPWVHVTTSSHRRGELIELTFFSKPKIAKLKAKKRAWPEESGRLQGRPAFTLLTPNKMAICVEPRENFPGGDWQFEEDREGPPSRAYLKLWEWGWRTSELPKPGQTALDLGASPGGWTWVLAKAGLHVHAYDRSPLALKLPKPVMDRIDFKKGDAFQVTPENAPATDWVFCDVIAEPSRTVELIESWVSTRAGLVFTIKFKGETDFSAIDRLSRVPNSIVRHLNVNKHEVTFWRLPISI